MPMKMSGNEKSAMIRVRSRSSLMRSRWASVSTPESSVMFFRLRSCSFGLRRHDLEVRVLERRRVRADERQRRLDRPQDRMDAATREHDLEWAFALDGQLEPRKLVAQAPSVVGIDEDVLLDQILLDVRR